VAPNLIDRVTRRARASGTPVPADGPSDPGTATGASASLGARVKVRQLVPFLALLLVIIAFSGSEGFLTTSNLENILRQLPVLLLVAVGQTFVILTGGIDLSVATNITLSGAVGAVLVDDLGEWALLLALPVGATIGLLNGLLVAKGRLPSFLVTLGTLFAVRGAAQLVTGGVPVPYVGNASRNLTSGSFTFLSIEITWIFAITMVIVGAAIVFAVATRSGHYIYAVGGGEVAARFAGIKVDRYKILAFTICGLFAGLAGMVLTMRAQSATPLMGEPFLLTSIAAVVVGGTGLLGGTGGTHWTILGSLVVITLDNGIVIAGINPDYQLIIRGLVIIVAAALTLRRVGVIK
jgi:ribose/xylose/arabinose/galactoside ABC-type transport system permease subunit